MKCSLVTLCVLLCAVICFSLDAALMTLLRGGPLGAGGSFLGYGYSFLPWCGDYRGCPLGAGIRGCCSS